MQNLCRGAIVQKSLKTTASNNLQSQSTFAALITCNNEATFLTLMKDKM